MLADVGRRLKALRMKLGLSQRALARRAGVSNGTISLIEQGRTDPTLGLLMKILDGVGVSVAEFFAQPLDETDKVFFSRDEMVDLGHGAVQLLQPGRSTRGRAIQILLERYRPGGSTGQVPLVHEGEECGFVIAGRIEVTVGDRVRVLGPGEAYYFRSSIPHRFRNVGEEECVIVSACTPPF